MLLYIVPMGTRPGCRLIVDSPLTEVTNDTATHLFIAFVLSILFKGANFQFKLHCERSFCGELAAKLAATKGTLRLHFF